MIWSLGLITVLASFGIVGARFRGRASADIVAQAKAMAAADAGLSLGIARALLQPPAAGASTPLRCVLPGGQHVAIEVADEAGKVDLNAAPPALLSALFSRLTRDREAGARVAADVALFRSAVREPVDDAVMRRYVSDGKPEGPKRAPFVTILELDQVVGVSHAMVDAALPFVTVRTQRLDVDFFRATPTMRRLFGVDDARPTALGTGAREVTVTSDATTADGARFVRQALVSLGGAQIPYVIHEWRHADHGIADADGIDGDAAERPCLSGLDRPAQIESQPRG